MNTLPLDSWDEKTDTRKRAAGLSARWVIENAFRAALLTLEKELPKSLSLIDYWKASEIPLSPEKESLLEIVDTEVTFDDSRDDEGFGRYYDCCRLAIGIVGDVGTILLLKDLSKRNRL